MKYVVEKTVQGVSAWVVIPPDADSSRATWTNCRDEATLFAFEIVARGWAWDLDAVSVPVVECPEDAPHRWEPITS